MTDVRFLNPPKLAKILGVSASQILEFIERRELRAINTSNGIRPRWKIDPADLKEFLERRSNTAVEKPVRTKRVGPVERIVG